MLSLPVNSTYGNWAMSSRLPSPSKDSLSESLSCPCRSELCLSGMSNRLLPLRDHRVPMAARVACGRSSQSFPPPATGCLQVEENEPFRGRICERTDWGAISQLWFTENILCAITCDPVYQISWLSQFGTLPSTLHCSGWRPQASEFTLQVSC